MSTAPLDVNLDFRAAARSAQTAEVAYRKEAETRIAGLARAREFAFRRAHLVETLASAARGAETAEAASAAQRGVLKDSMGWDEENESYRSILDRFAPVALAIAAAVRGPEEADTPVTPPVAAFEAFEAWYLGQFGQPFFALLDVYQPERPVVDF